MRPKEMLELVIEEAAKNGFTFQQIWAGLSGEATMEILDGDENLVFKGPTMAPTYGWTMNFPTLLFSHNFAKAYFGEEGVCKECGDWSEDGMCPPFIHCNHCMDMTEPVENWKYHLRQAVLSDDPLEYYYSQISPNSKPKSL